MTSPISSENEMNELEEIHRSWKKLEHNVKTVALGDGMSSGKEKKYQDYFDQGFSAGFSSGYAIGQLKGALFAEKMQKNLSIDEDQLLEEPKLGWCQMCTTSELSDKTISEVVAHQQQTNSENLKKLHDLYSASNIDIKTSNQKF